MRYHVQVQKGTESSGNQEQCLELSGRSRELRQGQGNYLVFQRASRYKYRLMGPVVPGFRFDRGTSPKGRVCHPVVCCECDRFVMLHTREATVQLDNSPVKLDSWGMLSFALWEIPSDRGKRKKGPFFGGTKDFATVCRGGMQLTKWPVPAFSSACLSPFLQ